MTAGIAGAQPDEPIGGDMGTYRIHCNVDGAKVFFNGDYKGEIAEGILDVPVYVTGTPYRTFTIEKEGYKTYTGTITSVPGKGQVIDIYAKLSALPLVEYGTLHLLVTPTLSTVFLDGSEIGLVPPNGVLIIRDIVPGNHAIQVSKDGYITQDFALFVAKNEVKKVPVTLQPAGSGLLTVSSEPPGGQVFLDGNLIGVTPMSVSDVAVGDHEILISMTGYSDYRQTVTVTEEGATVSADLVASVPSGRVGLSPLVMLGALAGCAFLASRRS
ncbi:MAG: PEGA domain-containing protein [Methanomicrobiales archaeon]|nr:PEGA domain-containing protein [Methanomicrobiales archaeon]